MNSRRVGPAFRARVLFGTLLLAPALTGCGEYNGEAVKTYPVTGRVSLPDGTTLAQGSVVFVPAPGSDTARQAAGRIESDGSFKLKTPNSGEGAAPGDYKVRLETSDTGAAPPVGSRSLGTAKFDSGYLDEDTSNVQFTVKPESNSFEIKLNPLPKSSGTRVSRRASND